MLLYNIAMSNDPIISIGTMSDFLKKDIKCLSCGNGPLHFRLFYNGTYTKSYWNSCCSEKCAYSYQKKENSRNSTPVQTPRNIKN